jgi:capsid protein
MLTAGQAVFDVSQFVRVPATQVLHWREVDRPGQLHGLPRITSALPLFAQLRRIRLATLTAVEFAAMVAGILKTNISAVPDGGPMPVENWSLFELVRGALLSLPEGWEATQFKSEHPNATFEMLQGEILGEAGRGVGAPRNVVLGTSKDLNFSSGRLDHLPYHRALYIERDEFRTVVLDPVLLAWEQEARMAGELQGVPPIEEWEWDWLWDSFDSIDQLKDAQADDIRIKNGTTTLKAVVGDPESHFDQLAREKAYAESKGLPWPAAAGAPMPAQPNDTSPQSPEQAVALALESVGLDETQSAEIMDALAPTFASMRGPLPRNGYHHNGRQFTRGRS